MNTTLRPVLKSPFTILFSLTLAISAQAAQDCRDDVNDPFSPDARLPSNPTLCLNTKTSRAIRVLNRQEKESLGFPHKKESRLVANFYHEKKFWLAEIPTSNGAVKD